MPRSPLLVAALVAIPVLAPRRAQTPPQIDERTRRVVGCYELTVGKWTMDHDANARPEFPPPKSFRLDSAGRPGFPASYYRVTPSSGGGALNIDAWSWIDTARISITWSANTLSGMHVELRVTRDSLVGEASAFGELDVISRAFPTASAVARRSACKPAP